MERNLYRCGKKPIPVWKETYTGVERHFYRHRSIVLKLLNLKNFAISSFAEITDMFLDRIELEDTEWKTPPEWDMLIFHYSDRYHHLHSKYTINRDWEVKSLKWEIMKTFFHPNKRWPRVRIQIEKLGKNGESVFLEKEIWILQMMEQKFGIYFPWYKLKKLYPKDYMLVPKNWDYNNMRYDNLHYLCKDEYTKDEKWKPLNTFYTRETCKYFSTFIAHDIQSKMPGAFSNGGPQHGTSQSR